MAKSKTLFQDTVARWSSRKWLLTILAAAGLAGAALQDGVITTSEMWAILAPVLGYLGVEGANDIKNS